ncbi:MAG: nucleotidyltransferase domain-containing protein [Rhodospirillales bacterium]|nr:nucleotidyltransferase domain-containing protein [Rhodospirillales bacterium]
MIPTIAAHRGEVRDLCRRFHVRRLDPFGSAARGEDFTEASDIGFLVEYEPAHAPPALGDFLAFRAALAAVLGRKVDVTVAKAVRNPFLRDAIARSRVTLHGA